jgi:hypothetical protein
MIDHPSDSLLQQQTETILVKWVAATISVPLAKKRLKLPDGSVVEIDGFNAEQKVVCEAFAHLGKLKAGQHRKLGNDILKLVFLERKLGPRCRKILVVADEDVRAALKGSSWHAAAVREFGVEVLHGPLEAGHVAEIVAAQVRQFR